MSSPLNPVDVESTIRELSERIAKGVLFVSKAERKYVDADRAYAHAYAVAYLNHDGPQQEKRYAADLATISQREARDIAHTEFRYADRQAKALQDQLRAWQSVGASIRSMYAVAGRGEQ